MLLRIALYGDSLTRGIPGAAYLDALRRSDPENVYLNYGKGGDTVVSLLHRVRKQRLAHPVGATVLWVGVNDVLHQLSPLSPLIRYVLRQPWAETPSDFRTHYRALLHHLLPHTPKLIAVAPFLIGEDLNNPWNRQLDGIAAIIQEEAGAVEASYLDLRPLAETVLCGKPISTYVPTSTPRVVLDALSLRAEAQIDQVAAARGLHLTLDGVHLNSTGAALVAQSILAALQ